MGTQSSVPLLAATLLAVTATSPLRAQIVADGASLALNNVTNSFPGNIIIGTNGSFTLLTISSSARLTNSANGLIGRNATAKSNEVQLASASARWLLGNHLIVGSSNTNAPALPMRFYRAPAPYRTV